METKISFHCMDGQKHLSYYSFKENINKLYMAEQFNSIRLMAATH